jgi:hypothetical protein
LFRKVATILEASWRVTGTVKIGDKCVRLVGSLKADIVPAISPDPGGRTECAQPESLGTTAKSFNPERLTMQVYETSFASMVYGLLMVLFQANPGTDRPGAIPEP